MDKTINYAVRTKGDSKIVPKTINIDGSEDPFYRYKMRQLYFQVVGRGKMIKTVLLNVDDVAKDLKIPPQYMTAYLGYEIGAKTKYDSKKPDRERASVSGEYESAQLSTIVKKFIQDMILCEYCKLPEVTLTVKDGSIVNTCRSCGGSSTLVGLKPKFSQHILNHPIDAQISKNEMKVRTKQDLSSLEAPKAKSKKTKKEKDEDDNIEWSVSMSQDAVNERRKNLLPAALTENIIQTKTDKEKEEEGEEEKEPEDPSKELQVFIENNPKGDIAGEVKRLQEKYGFTNSKRALVLFDAVFDHETVPSFKKFIPTFKKLFVDKKSKIGLLGSVARLFSELKNNKAFNKALEELYENEIVDEDTLLYWYDKRLTDEYTKKAISPFITWLREAEEESE
jgi:translation initiation factor 5